MPKPAALVLGQLRYDDMNADTVVFADRLQACSENVAGFRAQRTGAVRLAGIAALALAAAACNDAPNHTANDAHRIGTAPTAVSTPTYRIIAGVSMGGYGAGYLGNRFGALFDAVGMLGGPVDLIHAVDLMRREIVGGFAGAETTAPWGADRIHIGVDAVGGFSRTSYIGFLKDFALVTGGVGSYNPDNSYWPLGIAADDIDAINRARDCTNPYRITGVVDHEYNNPAAPYCASFPGAVAPDANGLWPAITFCDGKGIEEPPLALYDPADQSEAVEIALAVDCNDNGRRDPGEPILRQTWEPWQDTGSDGVASIDEPGYDPDRNPDPAGDDYDPLTHPDGSEGNLIYDPGEPFVDGGLDGIIGVTNPGDDTGFELNGRFDRHPALDQIDAQNPYRCLELFGTAGRRLYIDAGIHDPLGFAAASRRVVGLLRMQGEEVEVISGFHNVGLRYGGGSVNHLDFRSMRARHLYVEYGDPSLSEAEAHAAGGDGGHVGTPLQAAQRFLVMAQFLDQVWPDDLTAPAATASATSVTSPAAVTAVPQPFEPRPYDTLTFDSHILGVERRVLVTPPPGYDPEGTRRYPIIYMLHGHGMEPEAMAAAGAVLNLMMAQGTLKPAILVYPQGDGAFAADGSFWVNHADTSGQDPGRYADYIIHEVIPLVESRYHTLADPAQVTQYTQPDAGCVP